MSTTEAGFLILLFPGIFALLAGMMLTRFHWRPDIQSYRRQTRFLDVTLHPERYVKNEPLRAIRSLIVIAALLLAAAVSVVVYEILRGIVRL